MRRIRGVKVGDVEVMVRYIPGKSPFGLRIRNDHQCGDWMHVNMDPDSFYEFARQINFAWQEYEKANPPPGPKPGEWVPVTKTKAKAAAKK